MSFHCDIIFINGCKDTKSREQNTILIVNLIKIIKTYSFFAKKEQILYLMAVSLFAAARGDNGRFGNSAAGGCLF